MENYEVLWHRARHGADGARKGLERAQRKIRLLDRRIYELTLQLAGERSRAGRAEAENASLMKKIERLSLRIIELWGKEANDGRDSTGD